MTLPQIYSSFYAIRLELLPEDKMLASAEDDIDCKDADAALDWLRQNRDHALKRLREEGRPDE